VGLTRTIPIPAGITPSWPSIAAALTQSGETPAIRMIDNLPAFPGETPAENWQDVRVGLSGGMVTFRRTETELTCICWGTEDAKLKASFQAAVKACEAITGTKAI
jgi:hypothetical protein